MRTFVLLILVSLLLSGCSNSVKETEGLGPDRTVIAASRYPVAVDPARVGSYPALAKSGAGYFYDEVLEYRVWIHPQEGGDDYFRAFASYEPALEFSKQTRGAEGPLALVRQQQWVNEPEPGKFEPRSDERITEWQVIWLTEETKRTQDSIPRFLSNKAGVLK